MESAGRDDSLAMAQAYSVATLLTNHPREFEPISNIEINIKPPDKLVAYNFSWYSLVHEVRTILTTNLSLDIV